MKSIIGINTHILTPNKNPILTFLTIKKHHSNKYIYINTKIKSLSLTKKSIIGINTHILTPNKNPILTIKKHHRNKYACINNKKES